MPFAGPALAKATRREILRLAGGVSRRIKAPRFLDAGRSQTWRTDIHAFSGRNGTQKSHARQRLRAERDVPPQCDLLRLPRRARHGQLRGIARTIWNVVSRMSRPAIAEWPARSDANGTHASQRRLRRKRMYRVPHAEN